MEQENRRILHALGWLARAMVNEFSAHGHSQLWQTWAKCEDSLRESIGQTHPPEHRCWAVKDGVCACERPVHVA